MRIRKCYQEEKVHLEEVQYWVSSDWTCQESNYFINAVDKVQATRMHVLLIIVQFVATCSWLLLDAL